MLLRTSFSETGFDVAINAGIVLPAQGHIGPHLYQVQTGNTTFRKILTLKFWKGSHHSKRGGAVASECSGTRLHAIGSPLRLIGSIQAWFVVHMAMEHACLHTSNISHTPE